jgi:NitT/TauT family transport system substrate-binding protein
MMNDPGIRFTMAPEGTMHFARFLNKVGTIKAMPASWKDMFFPEIHDLPGT